MKSNFYCTIEAEIITPDFSNADVPLKQIADKIAAEAKKNIRKQSDVNGSQFRPLSVRTIKDKIREGSAYPRRALYRKGIMYNAIYSYKVGKNSCVVGVIPRGKPQRDIIAMIHQEIGPIIRSFLGMNRTIELWAKNRIERWLKSKSEKATKKSYRFTYT